MEASLGAPKNVSTTLTPSRELGIAPLMKSLSVHARVVELRFEPYTVTQEKAPTGPAANVAPLTMFPLATVGATGPRGSRKVKILKRPGSSTAVGRRDVCDSGDFGEARA